MNNEQFAKVIVESVSEFGIVDLVISATGLTVLAVWLVKTTFGVKALVNAPIRRIDMPIHLAPIPFFMWILTFLVLDSAKKTFFTDLAGWQETFADNLIMCLATAPPIATVLVIAWMHYARRLKGLGLNPQTISRPAKWRGLAIGRAVGGDLAAACLNLVVILPVVTAAANFTMLAAQFVAGPEYEWPKHEQLRMLLDYPQYSLRILIVIATIVIVPVMEEVVFRGLIQTLLRSYIKKAWLSIIFASLIFIVFHADMLHWPALFVLSLCLGYSYEKSGSLIRPIFIHSLFNALNVFTALSQ